MFDGVDQDPENYFGKMRIALLLMVIGGYSMGSAQDLVVRPAGDSVNCKIRGMDRLGIHYEFVSNGHLERVYVLKSDVRGYQEGFYSENYRRGKVSKGIRSRSIFRLGLQTGLAQLNDQSSDYDPEWLKDYADRLSSGTFVQTDIHFLVSKQWGIGLQGSWFSTSNSIDAVTVAYPDGTSVTGVLSDKIRVSLIGPSVLFMPDVGVSHLNLVLMGSVGVADMRNDAVFISPLQLTATAVGGRFGAGSEYRLRNGLGFGLFVHRVLLKFSSISINGAGADGTYSLTSVFSRWDVGASLSFCY